MAGKAHDKRRREVMSFVDGSALSRSDGAYRFTDDAAPGSRREPGAVSLVKWWAILDGYRTLWVTNCARFAGDLLALYLSVGIPTIEV